MSRLDLALIAVMAVAAYLGYRRGLLVGILSFVGLLGGAVSGMSISLHLVRAWVPGPQQTMAAMFVLVFVASAFQGAMGLVGVYLRRRLVWHPARLADAILGSLLSVTSALVLCWGGSAVLRQVPVPGLTEALRDSAVLGVVNDVVPAPGDRLVVSFRHLLSDSAFPQVFNGDNDETIAPVDPPREEVANASSVKKAAAGIVEVTGEAITCKQRVTGSGFVYSRGKVLTNAHVVAGVKEPTVRIGGKGRAYPATVVVYDSSRDIAVLDVPDLEATVLRLTQSPIARADDVVVAGFPNGGPYTASAGRVRDLTTVKGPDIYGKSTVVRNVLSLRAVVEHGSSGGPVLRPDGTVAGLVFAKSLEDDETAYALQLSEVAPVARAGIGATDKVDTGDCSD